MNIATKRLEITTVIGCKIACRSCPQGMLLKAYGKKDRPRILTMDGFRQLLSRVDTDVMICFAGMSEPWGNPVCTDMVEYAVKKGHPVSAYTTLVGWTQEDVTRLKQIHFAEFVLHLPDQKGNAKIPVTEEYLSLLKQVVEHKQTDRLTVTGLSCHGEVDPRVAAYVPKHIFLSRELNDRAGNVENPDVIKVAYCHGQMLCIRCGDRLDQNILLPDGTVLLCCMDYGMTHVLGNLYQASYRKILQGEAARKIRNAMACEGDPILCRKCVNAKGIHEIYQAYQEYYNWAFSLYEEMNRQKQATKQEEEGTVS